MGRKFVFVMVAVVALAGCSKVSDTATPTTATTTTTVPRGQIGMPVADGALTFEVTEASTPPHWYGPKPLGEWFIVKTKVSNTGDHPQTFSMANQKLIDTAGRTFDPNVDVSAQFNKNPTSFRLNPGFDVPEVIQILFDVPRGTPIADVELHESSSSSGVKVAVGQ